MTPAHLHVPPEPRIQDGWTWTNRNGEWGTKLEYTYLRPVDPNLLWNTYFEPRLHWQPSTALQAVGTGVLMGRHVPWVYFEYASYSDYGSISRTEQSARIGLGAK